MPLRTLITAAIAWLLFFISTAVVVCADEAAVAHLDQLITGQRWEQAIPLARELDEQPNATTDLTLRLARIARSLQQRDQVAEAAEFYHRAVKASDRPAAGNLPPETAVLVRLAAASVLTQAKNWTAATDAVTPLLSEKSVATPAQRKIAVSILLKIGAGSLAKGAAAQSAEAYSVALAHADRDQQPTAMLGTAWASAIMRDRPAEAAEKLSAFLERFPKHEDASRAARACIECYKQADMPEQMQRIQSQLINRWPDSRAALELIRSHRNTAPDLVPQAVANWLMSRAKSERISELDLPLTVLALQIAGNRQDLKAWAALSQHLAEMDQTGQSVSDVLSQLGQTMPADAERLATAMIAPLPNQAITPQAREAACRWAARNEKWSMLALASESEKPSESPTSRTASVERLMAEALVQLGRTPDALPWWNHVVDHHGAEDFATLLRCAESETSVGRDVSVASKRIDAARIAAGDDRFQLALVHLLDAELSIRQLSFDDARAQLESVVRESDTDVGIRGRAQWLIGETHYLQQDFTKAIDAYRRVEGIDPDGIWVSAALVQAGKSFEQLGRKRDASVCYGHLLSRFANTSHASIARRRMAALNDSNLDNSSETTRR
ncbi:MAG: tetratricopeptide repeat protein [Planctomycetota bacterium]